MIVLRSAVGYRWGRPGYQTKSKNNFVADYRGCPADC